MAETLTVQKKKSRVIVIQSPTLRTKEGEERQAFDFTPARKFGTVEVLLEHGKGILTPDVFRELVEERLKDFNPEADYIVPAGEYSVLLLVGMILGRRHGRVRILRWVHGAKAYQPLLIDIRS